jgi:hypothetical protein
MITQTKIVVTPQFTFMAWFTFIAINSLLLMGHLWDNPVLCQTVLNCRWTYIIMCSWLNICLYIAY